MLGIFYNYRGWQGTNHPDGHFKWLYISRILIDSLDTNSSQPEALPRYDASEHIPGDFSLCQYPPENAEHPRHESPDIQTSLSRKNMAPALRRKHWFCVIFTHRLDT